MHNPLLALRSSYSQKSRAKRAKIFNALFPDLANETVIDLGGGKGEHIAKVLPGYQNITIADFNEMHLAMARENFGYKTMRLDGSQDLPFGDKAFDVVYCNSVIEHVTGPKDEMVEMTDTKRFADISKAHQKKFASEIRRIGKGYFVQTPYKWFPVESHTITPSLVQLLPRKAQLQCYKMVPKKRTTPDFYLLTKKDMRELFPDADFVYEKSFGMLKSIIAVKRP